MPKKVTSLPASKSTASIPHVIVEARAGSGKSTTLVEGLKFMRGDPTKITPSPQQQKVWEAMALSKGVARSIGFVAFNKSIAAELQKRVPAGCDACTMHSLGFSAVRKAFGGVAVNQYRVSDIICDKILRVDPRELRKKDGDVLRATQELVSLCKMNLVSPFTPGPVLHPEARVAWDEALDELAAHYNVELNGSRRKVYDLVPQVLAHCLRVEDDRQIDFDDMVWLPVALGLAVKQYDLLLVDEAQDLNRCQQALAKKAGKRLILCGDRHQCHPSGTLVTKTGGVRVPIETLKVGDQLVSFNPCEGRLVGTATQGRRVEAIASREYTGKMYCVNGTRCTPNHKWLTRFSDESRNRIALYLMELEDGSFRIGITQLMIAKSNRFGPARRARQEGGVKLWLLDVFEDRTEAREQEFKNSMRYQVPQRAQYEEGDDSWPRDLINEGTPPRVDDLLARYGKMYEYPLWAKGDSQHIGSRQSHVTQVCNLIPGVSVVAGRVGETQEVSWELANITTSDWSGRVWSLQVQPTERDRRLYLAENMTVSNSIYGFAGADSESIVRMQQELSETPGGCVLLPLTVTRRCGKAIVAEANKIVADFEAHEANCEGKVLYARIT